MMFRFKHGRPLKRNRNPEKTYRLTVKSYSGDGDSDIDYTEHGDFVIFGDSGYDHKEARLLEDILTALSVAKTFYDFAEYKQWDKLCAILEDENSRIHDNICCGLIPHDVCYDGRQASLESWELTYFDEDGIEREVTVGNWLDERVQKVKEKYLETN